MSAYFLSSLSSALLMLAGLLSSPVAKVPKEDADGQQPLHYNLHLLSDKGKQIMREIARQFRKEMEPNQQSEKEKQIVLRVTVAEVDKTAVERWALIPSRARTAASE